MRQRHRNIWIVFFGAGLIVLLLCLVEFENQDSAQAATPSNAITGNGPPNWEATLSRGDNPSEMTLSLHGKLDNESIPRRTRLISVQQVQLMEVADKLKNYNWSAIPDKVGVEYGECNASIKLSFPAPPSEVKELRVVFVIVFHQDGEMMQRGGSVGMESFSIQIPVEQ